MHATMKALYDNCSGIQNMNLGPSWAIQVMVRGPSWAVQVMVLGPFWAIQVMVMGPAWAIAVLVHEPVLLHDELRKEPGKPRRPGIIHIGPNF